MTEVIPDPSALPAGDAQQGQTGAGDGSGSTAAKNDDFYDAWDRFTQRNKKKSSKNRKGGAYGAVEATVSAPVLETDVEGRPGHPVEQGKDGVVVRSQGAARSYEEAVANCKAKVQAISRECRRLNQKYYDRTFHLPDADTLMSLGASDKPSSLKGLQGIGSVKRVDRIFEDPEFYEDGATADDVRQGQNGDCWFLAAITALSGKPKLIERVCVDRDEDVGVYGFVFFRDGEWISEVIDDRLALTPGDDDKAAYQTEFLLRVAGDKDIRSTPLITMQYGQDYGLQFLPKEFRDSLRKGSNALYFASSKTSNETWLPLLEKAYAKAHGDYQAIEGGFPGEGIEDLTGGIATYIKTEDVLDKEQLWRELLQVNDKFLFGCGSREGRDSGPSDEEGFVRGHAYTVLEAREVEVLKQPDKNSKKDKKKGKASKGAAAAAKKDDGDHKDEPEKEKVRLLKLHNPWGKQEWNGRWSDGSKEWTPEVMKELNHTFGDDGLFWISYDDFLQFYPEIDRIRLIGPEWSVTQQWTSVTVPWTAEYNDTSFKLTVRKEGPVVIVLSQPDDRYFRGLEGRYRFQLHFRLYREGEDTYLLRSMEDSGSDRSCSAELTLAEGTYYVRVKVTAARYDFLQTREEVIKAARDSRRDKLLAVGKSFDAAHSKGHLREAERAKWKAEKREQKDKEIKQLKKEREDARNERMRNKLKARRIKAEELRKKEEKVKKKKAELEAKKKEKEAEKARKKAEAEAAKTKTDGDKPNAKDDKVTAENGKPTDTVKPTDSAEGAVEPPDKPTDANEKTADGTDKSATDAKDTSSSSTESVGKLTPSSTSSDMSTKPAGETKAKADEGGQAQKKETSEGTQTEKGGTTQIEKKDADEGTQTEKKGADEGTQTEEKSVDEGSQTEKKDADEETQTEKTKADDNAQTEGKSSEKKGTTEKKVEIVEPKKEADAEKSSSDPKSDEAEASEPSADKNEKGSSATEDKPAADAEEDAECESEEDPDVSDVSSVHSEDFPWDDTMDGPLYSDSDDNADESSDSDKSDDEGAAADDLYANDPWNAICVLGLRVCSLEDGLAIDVCRAGGADCERAKRPRFDRRRSEF